MRKIIFRGKDKDGNTVFGDLIHGVGDKEGLMYILPQQPNLAYIPNCDPLDGVRVEPSTIEQFTGFSDRNGKEIYEGDFIKHKNSDVWDPVYWTEEKGCFVVDYPDMTFYNIPVTCILGDIDLENFEIVGNIHDNPDALID